MASETTMSTMQYAIVEYTEQQAIESAATKKVFRPVLQTPRNIFDYTGKGDTKNVLQSNAMTFAALTEWPDAHANTYALTPTKRALTPVLIGASMELSWEAATTSDLDPYKMIADEASIAYAGIEDSGATLSWAANYTEAYATTHELGGAYALTASLVQQAVSRLMASKAQPPYNLFIDPIQWGHLMNDTVAVQLMKEFGTQPAGFSATEGLRMDQFVGKMFGCNIWAIPGGMITSTTLKAMMTGQNALGLAFKKISTPLSPTPSELNIETDWYSKGRAYYCNLTCCFDIGGIVGASATTNPWVVELATATT